MLDQFSATVEKIYAAAADGSLWGDALRAVEDYTGSTGAVLNLVPRSSSALPLCLAGSFSREDCTEYAVNYMWRCPRIAFGAGNPHVPIHYDRMILSEAQMDRDATYEWYGSHGLRYYVAGWIGGTGTHNAYMSLQRSRKQGHVDAENVEQFALVLRHMAQALALAVKLGTLEQQSSFNLQLINLLPTAVFALDENGDVVLTNTKADRLLDRGDGLFLFGRKLQCRLGSQQPSLDKLIASALGSNRFEARGGWLRIERSSGLRPYVALVGRIDSSESLVPAVRPRALLIVADPGDSVAADEKALHDLYGLTGTEARLASAISAGHSLESAAALLHVQIATARSHLKSVFAKLGVNRQQDLVRLLTSLSTVKL